MKCPYCSDDNTRVIDSRPADDNSAIRRRRQCDVCGKRFTTYEKVEAIPLMVIKKDKSREPYDREKLMQGLFIAGVYRLFDDRLEILLTLGDSLISAG